jgi:hypothetical protein
MLVLELACVPGAVCDIDLIVLVQNQLEGEDGTAELEEFTAGDEEEAHAVESCLLVEDLIEESLDLSAEKREGECGAVIGIIKKDLEIPSLMWYRTKNFHWFLRALVNS